jgi:Late competence development protein ComFB
VWSAVVNGCQRRLSGVVETIAEKIACYSFHSVDCLICVVKAPLNAWSTMYLSLPPAVVLIRCLCAGVVCRHSGHDLFVGGCMVLNFEQVHNYFERLVFEDVSRMSGSHPQFNADMLCDVACVALSRLPARYVRHDVDMMFYLTEHERHAIDQAMAEALDYAFKFVGERVARRAVLG